MSPGNVRIKTHTFYMGHIAEQNNEVAAMLSKYKAVILNCLEDITSQLLHNPVNFVLRESVVIQGWEEKNVMHIIINIYLILYHEKSVLSGFLLERLLKEENPRNMLLRLCSPITNPLHSFLFIHLSIGFTRIISL